MPGVTDIEIKQLDLDPDTPAIAKVQIHFVVTEILPDIVQIYAQPSGGDKGIPIETIEMTPPENGYDKIIDLYAGIIYTIWFCPRTETNDVPDDLIDGQDWQTFCVSSPFTTIADTHSPPSHVPEIISLISFPQTFKNDGAVKVEWSSEGNNKFQVRWGLSTHINDDYQVEGNSGLFVHPTKPLLKYRFKVQGKRDNARWSAWSEPKEIQAVASLRSVRQFFSETDLNQGVRSHLPVWIISLRNLMGL